MTSLLPIEHRPIVRTARACARCCRRSRYRVDVALDSGIFAGSPKASKPIGKEDVEAPHAHIAARGRRWGLMRTSGRYAGRRWDTATSSARTTCWVPVAYRLKAVDPTLLSTERASVSSISAGLYIVSHDRFLPDSCHLWISHGRRVKVYGDRRLNSIVRRDPSGVGKN